MYMAQISWFIWSLRMFEKRDDSGFDNICSPATYGVRVGWIGLDEL